MQVPRAEAREGGVYMELDLPKQGGVLGGNSCRLFWVNAVYYAVEIVRYRQEIPSACDSSHLG